MKSRRLPFLAVIASLALPFAQAGAQETVVVPTRVIYPGQEVALDALEVVPLRRQLPDPSRLAMEIDDFVGKVARRTLLPGRMVPVDSMRDAYLVEAGKPIELQFVQGQLVISTMGVPLQPGAAGDIVRVRNIDSGTIISGIVMADGTVRVSS